jgi:RND superfamily putative drug exporter
MGTNDSPPRKGIAHRMGHWSAQHRKLVIFGWIAFVVGSFAIGNFVTTKTIDPNTSGSGEAGKYWKLLTEEFEQPAGESILVQSSTATIQDAAFVAAVKDATATLRKQPGVTNIRSPLGDEGRTLIGQDGHAALIQFDVEGDPDTADERIQPVLDATDGLQARHPALFVGEFGDASANKALNGVFTSDLEKAGLISIPVTLIILLLTFGSLVAALIPLVLALSSVFATLGLLAIPSHVIPMDDSVAAVVLLIGLAVGVDYSMFYLKREREERRRGATEEAALEAAEATSGRAVLISGATVVISMAGLFFTRDATFMSFAVAMMMVVAVAMLGSVTVLPAVLSKLGDNVDRARVPFLGRYTAQDGESRVWGAILTRVLRRPVVWGGAAAALLIALGLPALQMKTTIPGPETYPKDLAVMKVYNRIQDAFPGTQIAAIAVIKAPNVNAPEVKEAIGQLEWRALVSGVMHEPIETRVSPNGKIAMITIPVDGEGTDKASVASLNFLRDQIMPFTLQAVPGAEAGVTGETAFTEDFNDQMKSSLPWVLTFVLGFAFLLLLLSFRSLIVPVKAIVLNLLSVAAAYGVTVLVFQYGWGKELLGFEFTGGVVAFLPVFLFVILFGLSMDYHVFILSRVRESVDKGMKTEDAVAHGIKATAGVVTSAAIVMVFVFGVFGTLQILFLKEFGVALASAILIDATIVRAFLLPATMKLLGEWNWYLPKWLDWLPHLEHGEQVPETPAMRPT